MDPTSFLALFTAAAAAPDRAVAQQPHSTLQLNIAQRDSLASSDTARWTITAVSGEYVALEVRQRGVDVVVRVIGPDGAARPDVDSPTGTEGTEHVRWIAHAEGDWTVIVFPFDESPPGEYEIEWVTRRTPTASDRTSIRNDSLVALARVVTEEGNQAYGEGTRDGVERAIERWTEAGALYRRVGDGAGEGLALHNIGFFHDRLGRADSALVYYLRALPLRRAAGPRANEARTLGGIALAYAALRQRDSALVHYASSLEIRRELGDGAGEAVVLDDIGELYWTIGELDSARIAFSHALERAAAAGDRRQEAETLFHLAATLNDQGRPDSALAYFHRLLDRQREAGAAEEALTLGNIGIAHADLGRPDSAHIYHHAALEVSRALGDRKTEGMSLSSIARLHDRLGRPDSARAYFSLALRVLRDSGERDLEAIALTELGTWHRNRGRADSALVYFDRALRLQRELGDRNGEMITLSKLSDLQVTLGRADSALFYNERALAIARDDGDRFGEAVALTLIGEVLWRLDRTDSALVVLRAAMRTVTELGERRTQTRVSNAIGNVYADLGQPDSALAYFRRSLSLARQLRTRYEEGIALNNIGYMNAEHLGRPDSALAYYAHALAAARQLDGATFEATVLSSIGFARSDLRDYPSAVAYFDSASAVRSRIALHAGGDQNRLSFAETHLSIYRMWAAAWFALGPVVGWQEAGFAALAASERGPAQALLDLMRRNAGEANVRVAAAGEDMAAEGRRLAAQAAGDDEAALYYLVTDEILLIWLLLPSGELLTHTAEVAEDSIAAAVAALRAGLRADSAAVRSGLATRGRSELEATWRGLGIGTDTPRADADAAARRLVRWILPSHLVDRLRDVRGLVVLPHGPLNLLPFAVLPAGAGDELLGLRFALRYAPSLATLGALGQSQERRGVMAAVGALVVGNPAMPRIRGHAGDDLVLAPLPGAEAEAVWVAGQLSASSLAGAAASEQIVRERMPSAALVHLATHGFAYSSEASARSSFVALAPGAGHDGLLTVGELLDDVPALSAELVVLSACQTGLGDIRQAEGTVGLQRAFLAKGARTVLVSLWSVSDEATELLMRSFYTHWLGGASKPEALRRAQAEVRGEPGSRFYHPRYWAAFQLVGAG